MKEKIDISKYIKIPYKNKGRDINGCDCWGLIRLIYINEYGITLPILSSNYEEASDAIEVGYTVENEKLSIRNKQKNIPEYGDLIIFNINRNPCHIGMYIGKNRVLHILKGTDSVIESLNSFRLKGRIEGYYEVW